MSYCKLEIDQKGCCCDCTYQHKVYKHPWNKEDYAKGSIREQMGYICLIPGDKGGIFSDREHSMCEMYNKK